MQLRWKVDGEKVRKKGRSCATKKVQGKETLPTLQDGDTRTVADALRLDIPIIGGIA